MSYGTSITLDVPFAEAVARVRAALKEQGFGVLTEIDVTATLQAKLGEQIEDYVILRWYLLLASRALGIDRRIGLLLPCNVVVRATADGTIVEALDPQIMATLTGLTLSPWRTRPLSGWPARWPASPRSAGQRQRPRWRRRLWRAWRHRVRGRRRPSRMRWYYTPQGISGVPRAGGSDLAIARWGRITGSRHGRGQPDDGGCDQTAPPRPGQVGGVIKMIEEGRDCADIVTQLAAASPRPRPGGLQDHRNRPAAVRPAGERRRRRGQHGSRSAEKLFLSLA